MENRLLVERAKVRAMILHVRLHAGVPVMTLPVVIPAPIHAPLHVIPVKKHAIRAHIHV